MMPMKLVTKRQKKIGCRLQVVRVAGCRLQVAGYRLQVAGYRFKV